MEFVGVGCVGAGMLTVCVVFFQAEDGIRDLVRSRGLGDVYKRQALLDDHVRCREPGPAEGGQQHVATDPVHRRVDDICLLYTSDAADERSSVDLGGRRIIKKKNTVEYSIERVQGQSTDTIYKIASKQRK